MESTASLYPWIYFNGPPGVGKLTIAQELQKLIPGSKILHNHLIIDLCRNIFPQGSPEYENLRMAVRREMLDAITASEAGLKTTYIFTGSHTPEVPIGPVIAHQFISHAISHNIPFISVVFTCEEEEHIRRATSESRQRNAHRPGKLTDIPLLKRIRGLEPFVFNCEYEIKAFDVTGLLPAEAARKIHGFVEDSLKKEQLKRAHVPST